MSTLAFIPCRSGSKGFPNKNVCKLNDLTLIEHAVRVAKNCSEIKDVFISTDSEIYQEIGVLAGAKTIGLRSQELSEDRTKTVDVVLEFLERLSNAHDYDQLVLLQPTSPMRSAQEIAQMLTHLKTFPAVVTVEEIDEPHPYKMKVLENNLVKPLISESSSEIPRQELPKTYKLNGAIYVIRISALKQFRTFLPPKTYGYKTEPKINIDSENDYILLKELVRLKRVFLE